MRSDRPDPRAAVVTAPDDVVAMLAGHERWSSARLADADADLLGADPPEHTAVRAALEQACGLALQAIETSAITAIVDDACDKAASITATQGSVDAVTVIALATSSKSLALLLGFDPDHAWTLREWARLRSGQPAFPPAAFVARDLLVRAFVSDAPEGSMLAALRDPRIRGGASRVAVFNACKNSVVSGGLETTSTLLTAIIEQAAAATSSDDPVAVALRARPPLRWQERSNSNGDLAAVDIEAALRAGAPSSLAFGHGIHRCLGESFARRQALALSRALRSWRVQAVSDPEFRQHDRVTVAERFVVRVTP